jgi:TRAP-type C4-dicarboxylate transport system permease small subunit
MWRRSSARLRRRRRLRLLSAAATALLFIALAALFGVTLAEEIKWGETSMGLGVPRWWFTAPIPLFCAAIAWRAADAGWRTWSEPFHADESPAAPDR